MARQVWIADCDTEADVTYNTREEAEAADRRHALMGAIQAMPEYSRSRLSARWLVDNWAALKKVMEPDRGELFGDTPSELLGYDREQDRPTCCIPELAAPYGGDTDA